MKRRFAVLFAAVVMLASMPQVANAETAAEQRAAALKLEGDQAFDAARDADALRAYDASYALVKNPALHYNRGRVLQRMGRYPEALASLEEFERSATPELRAKVPRLAELLAEIRSHVSRLAISCNVDGARVIVRDHVIGKTPLAEITLNAGAATVQVEAADHAPFVKQVNLAPQGVVHVHAELARVHGAATLVVRSAAGSSVFVDGKDAGNPPIERVVGAGEHVIVVRKVGFDDARTTAMVALGERKEIDVALSAHPSILSRWWFWTAAGALVVGGVAIAIAATTEREADSGTISPGRVAGPLISF